MYISINLLIDEEEVQNYTDLIIAFTEIKLKADTLFPNHKLEY